MNLKFVLIVLVSGAIAIGCAQQQTSNPTSNPTGNEPTTSTTTEGETRNPQGNLGAFRGVDHPTRGQVRVSNDNGLRYLEFSDDFRTDNGPDLYVVLHQNSEVGKGVKEGDYVTLARLRQTNGGQRYQIPRDLNLSKYKSVAIWCRQFNVTFGYAPLEI